MDWDKPVHLESETLCQNIFKFDLAFSGSETDIKNGWNGSPFSIKPFIVDANERLQVID